MMTLKRPMEPLRVTGSGTINSLDETAVSDEEDAEVNHIIVAISMPCSITQVVAKSPDQDAFAIAKYSIVLSPTYQVPVLYFTLASAASSMTSTIEDVYSLLVEPSRRAEMNSVGIMGAISYAVGALPVFKLDVNS